MPGSLSTSRTASPTSSSSSSAAAAAVGDIDVASSPSLDDSLPQDQQPLQHKNGPIKSVALAVMSTPIVQYGMSAVSHRIPSSVSSMSSSMASRASPLIDAVDERAGKALESVSSWSHSLSTSLVPSEWFKDVDSLIRTKVESLDKTFHFQHRIVEPAQALFHHSIDVYLTLRNGKQPKNYNANQDQNASASSSGVVGSFGEFIGVVKTRVGDVYSDKLEPYLLKLYSSAQTWAISDLQKLQANAGNIGNMTLSTAIQTVNQGIQTRWNGLLNSTKNVIDQVIPELDQQNNNSNQAVNGVSGVNESVSIVSLSRRVQKRLTDRATKRLNDASSAVKGSVMKNYEQLSKVSRERVSPVLHVDPVNLAENVVSSINSSVTPTLVATRESIHSNVDILKHSIEGIQSRLSNLAKDASIRSSQAKTSLVASSPLAAKLNHRLIQLQSQAAIALTAVKDLTSQSSTFVLNRQMNKLPKDALHLLVAAPQLIFHQLIHETDKANGQPDVQNEALKDEYDTDQDFQLLLQKLEDALGAVKHVFSPSPSQDNAQPGLAARSQEAISSSSASVSSSSTSSAAVPSQEQSKAAKDAQQSIVADLKKDELHTTQTSLAKHPQTDNTSHQQSASISSSFPPLADNVSKFDKKQQSSENGHQNDAHGKVARVDDVADEVGAADADLNSVDSASSSNPSESSASNSHSKALNQELETKETETRPRNDSNAKGNGNGSVNVNAKKNKSRNKKH